MLSCPCWTTPNVSFGLVGSISLTIPLSAAEAFIFCPLYCQCLNLARQRAWLPLIISLTYYSKWRISVKYIHFQARAIGFTDVTGSRLPLLVYLCITVITHRVQQKSISCRGMTNIVLAHVSSASMHSRGAPTHSLQCKASLNVYCPTCKHCCSSPPKWPTQAMSGRISLRTL